MYPKLRFISFALGIISAALFFTPIFKAVSYLGNYSDTEEAGIFFFSFFADNKLFFTHACAVSLSFIAFLLAIFGIFKDNRAIVLYIFAIVLPLIVIFAYIAGYDKLFIFIYKMI